MASSLLNRILRRPTDLETPMTSQSPTEKSAPDVLMQFLTVGGATVELRSHKFSTHYTGQGRPYVGDHAHEVDGYAWRCLGCDATGGTDGRSYIRSDYGRYLPTEDRDAREDANSHAEKCRAMPKPTA